MSWQLGHLKVTRSGYLSLWDASGGWRCSCSYISHLDDHGNSHDGERMTYVYWRTQQTIRSQNYIEYLCEPDLVSITSAPTTAATFRLRRSVNSLERKDGPAARSSGVRASSLRRNEFRIRLFTFYSTTHNELLHYLEFDNSVGKLTLSWYL